MNWIGCGGCDVAFICFNGEARCIRLASALTVPPALEVLASAAPFCQSEANGSARCPVQCDPCHRRK